MRAVHSAGEVAAFFMFAHERGGGPKMDLVGAAQLDDGDRQVSLSQPGTGFCFMMAVSFIGQVWKRCTDDGGAIHHIFISPVFPEPRSPAMRGDMCVLHHDWEHRSRRSEQILSPPIIHTDLKPRPAIVEALFRGIRAATERAYKKPDKASQARVKLLPPGAGDGAASESDGSAEHDISGESGASDDDVDAPAPPPHPLLSARAAPSDPADRKARAEPWGPWSISQYISGDVHRGFYANCGRHFSATGGCRKLFTFSSNSPDETRCLANQWLLQGRTILPGHPRGRDEHVFNVRRESLALRPEAELDAECLAL